MKTSYVLMIVTIIAKIFGLLREKALAQFFGTAIIADVFLVAFQIPLTFTNVITGATANGYIPIYDQVKNRSNVEKANLFTSNLANIAFIISTLISIVGIIFARPLVKFMAIGFNEEELKLCVFMTRAALLSLGATSVFSIFKAYLQIERMFVVSVLNAIFMNIIIIVAMWFGYKTDSSYLAIGIFCSFVFQYVIFLPYIRKSGYRHKFIVDFKDKDFREMMKIIVPVLISTSVIELNFIISKSIASAQFEGAISTLNYAYKLQTFVTGIVITSITTAVYPEMARMGALKDYDGLRKQTSEAIFTMSLLVIPASVGLFIFAGPIVRLLFLGGAFKQSDIFPTQVALAAYAVGIIGIGVREIISRVFYTLMDAKTPVINSIIMVVLNVVLSIVLAKVWGIKGLALATSISFIIGALLIVLDLKKKIGHVITATTAKDIIKISIATGLMAVLSRLVFNFLFERLGSNLSLIVAIMVAGIVYLVSLLIFRPSEINSLIEKLKNKRKK